MSSNINSMEIDFSKRHFVKKLNTFPKIITKILAAPQSKNDPFITRRQHTPQKCDLGADDFVRENGPDKASRGKSHCFSGPLQPTRNRGRART